MIGVRQRIGHIFVLGIFVLLQPANHNAGIKPNECWSNNNTDCSPTGPFLSMQNEKRFKWHIYVISTYKFCANLQKEMKFQQNIRSVCKSDIL